MKGLSKINKQTTLTDPGHSLVGTRGEAVGEGEGREVGGDGWRADLGGEHTVRGADEALQYGTPDTYVILLTSGTPTNSIENFFKRKNPSGRGLDKGRPTRRQTGVWEPHNPQR